MADVARLAGVSAMTVSRVLNDSSAVSAVTRVRVRAAIAALGYRPNPAARALATGRTRQIGVLSVNGALFAPTTMLSAIEQAAHDPGYAVTITGVRADGARSLDRAWEELVERAVDGVLVLGPWTPAPASTTGLPVVAVGGVKGSLPTVAADEYQGALSATRHLLGLGHRRIAHVAGPADWSEAAERERGWREAMIEAGLPPGRVLRGDWTPRSGYEAGSALAASREHTAVFAASDQIAIGVLRAFAEAGIDVPGDVSVVGFDDIPDAPFFPPPLTTVRRDLAEVGRLALSTLVDRVDGTGTPPDRQVVPAELVVRASSGRAPVPAVDPIGRRRWDYDWRV